MASSSLTRPFEAIPPAAAPVLRPVLQPLADETIAAIAREVPDYARAMEGEFGQIVRLGVEVAFNRFVDLIADPTAGAGEARDTYVDLGRGEYHAGRSLDALLAAYRVGARLAWRRFVVTGREAGLEPEVLYDLGEAIFAYIDEISAESAAGYAQEQPAAAGATQRRRRHLVRVLAEDPPASEEAIRTAAAAADWTLPRTVAALLAERDEESEEQLDAAASALARRIGEGAVGAAIGGLVCAFVPDPDAPARRRRIEAALDDERAALGPAVPWARAS